jgi:hypothetical protein
MIEEPRRPAALTAERLGCTEGQVFTMLIGLAFALLLAVPGIPAVLRDRPAREQPAVGLRPLDDAPPLARPTSTATASAPVDTGGSPPPVAPGPAGGGRSPRPATHTQGALPSGQDRPSSGATTPPPAPGTIGVLARVESPGAPGGLAVGPDGTVYVTTDNGTARGSRGPSHVFAFRADGTAVAGRAVTGQAADRTGGLTGVAVDPTSGSLAVLDPEGRRILRLDMSSGAQSVLAEIPDLPPCFVSLGQGGCQPGFQDRAPSGVSAIYDDARNLFFTDPAQDTIWRLPSGARAPEAWYQSTDFSVGDGPFGLAVQDATVHFTVGTSNDLATLGTGALYRLEIDPDGSAGARSIAHSFARGEQPGALAVASSEATYVVLRDSGAIVTIAPDGSQRGRLEPPGSGAIPLDTPSAIALVPGALLVANGRASDDPDRWAILAVAVADEPARTPAARSSRHRISKRGRVT